MEPPHSDLANQAAGEEAERGAAARRSPGPAIAEVMRVDQPAVQVQQHIAALTLHVAKFCTFLLWAQLEDRLAG